MSKQRLEVVSPEMAPPVWAALRNEAAHAAQAEPTLASLLNAVVLKHDKLLSALSYQLARKLGDQELRAMSFREIAPKKPTPPSRTRWRWWRPTCARCSSATLPARAMSSPSCSSRDSWRCRRIGSATGCGPRARPRDRGPSICKAGCRRCSRSTSTPRDQDRVGRVYRPRYRSRCRRDCGHRRRRFHAARRNPGRHGLRARRDRHPKIGKGVLLGAGAKVLGNIRIGDPRAPRSPSARWVLKAGPPASCGGRRAYRPVWSTARRATKPARTMDHTLAEDHLQTTSSGADSTQRSAAKPLTFSPDMH